MEKQIIISIGRQYGSAGHIVAKKLAEKLDIEVLDRNLLDEVAGVVKVDTNNLKKYDEKPRLRFLSRTVRGYSNSPEENIAEMQFALLKSKEADGDSFVIVGRCADELFHGKDNFINVFLSADMEFRINRVMERHEGLDRNGAIKKIAMHDKKRAAYHDFFAKNGKWGERGTYDMCLNVSKIGIDASVEILYQYVQSRIKEMK